MAADRKTSGKQTGIQCHQVKERPARFPPEFCEPDSTRLTVYFRSKVPHKTWQVWFSSLNLMTLDWYPNTREVGFEALINTRPRQQNYGMEIQDPGLRTQVETVVRRVMEGQG